MAIKTIDASELLPPPVYEARRAAIRAEIIRLKARRRVEVGPWVSLAFENRATVLYQIQEMCAIEGLKSPEAIAHEIETYSELLPGPGELSATLFIEIPDAATRSQALTRLGGLEKSVRLKAAGELTAAQDKRPIDPRVERPGFATCVYYLRLPVSERMRAALAAGTPDAWLEIAHPAYKHAAALLPDTAREIAPDAA